MNPIRLYFFPPTLTRIERIASPLLYILSIAPPLIFYLGLHFSSHQLQKARAANAPPPSPPIALLASLIAASLLAAIITFILWLTFRRRSRRRIQQLDFRLCPNCRYELTSSATDGTCPECGRLYTDADLRHMWRRAYGLDRLSLRALDKPLTFRRSSRRPHP